MHDTTVPVETLELADGKAHLGRRLTEEEFVAGCDEDTRAEWIDGEVIVMAPASGDHVDLNWWLTSLLRFFVEHHNLGVARGPEFQVRLPAQRRRRVPDVLFVARDRLGILRENHVEGAPDLIIEIVSPDSVARDWRDKYFEYQAAGVREYWVVDPGSQRVEAYTLSDDAVYQRITETDGRIASAILPGLFLRPSWLWADRRPKVLDALGELGVPTQTPSAPDAPKP